MSNDGEKVSLDVMGEDSNISYHDQGLLRAKPLLTASDRFVQDRIRREILGPEAGTPGVQAAMRAEMLSQLNVRIADPCPPWWKDSAEAGVRGMLIKDDNVIERLYEAVMAVDVRVKRQLAKDEEKAKKDLKKDAAEG